MFLTPVERLEYPEKKKSVYSDLMIHTACKRSLEHAICVTVSCQACNLLLVGTLSCGCQLSRLLFFHGVLEHTCFNSVKKNVG